MSRTSPDSTLPPHPTPEEWLARALGALASGRARTLERHARLCLPCRGLRDAARLLALAASPGAFEPVPAAARRRAEATFRAPRPRLHAVRSTAGDLRAPGRLRVTWTSAASAPGAWALAGGMRGTAAERRCTIASSAHRVDLEWLPAGSGWHLRGRVASEPGAPTPRLRLELAGGGSRHVTPGPRGFFGPVRVTRPELRVYLETAARSWRSAWVPATPRPRPGAPRKPRG